MDKTAFKAQTAAEASASHGVYYRSLTWKDRLRIAGYLNSIAYNFPAGLPPKMDKNAFSVRGRNNG